VTYWPWTRKQWERLQVTSLNTKKEPCRVGAFNVCVGEIEREREATNQGDSQRRSRACPSLSSVCVCVCLYVVVYQRVRAQRLEQNRAYRVTCPRFVPGQSVCSEQVRGGGLGVWGWSGGCALPRVTCHGSPPSSRLVLARVAACRA